MAAALVPVPGDNEGGHIEIGGSFWRSGPASGRLVWES
jgi:hypothetical protein